MYIKINLQIIYRFFTLKKLYNLKNVTFKFYYELDKPYRTINH